MCLSVFICASIGKLYVSPDNAGQMIFHSFVKTLSTYKQVNNYFYILVHKVGGGGGVNL